MPHKNPEDRAAYRQRYYEEHRDWEISRVKNWKKGNPEKYRPAEAKRKRASRARKRKRAALLARVTEAAKKTVEARARGYSGDLKPGHF